MFKVKKEFHIPFYIFLITLVIYTLSNFGRDTLYNYFILLADAFLHGRLYLLNNPPWLNELIGWHGRYYVVYPPMPAILLMPFVGIFGITFPQPIFSIIVASVNVTLAYLVFLKLFNDKKLAVWMSILFGFGSMQWFHAQIGSAWYLAHIVALFFIWLALLEALTKRRLFIIGILIGAAYLARLPAILVVVFIPLFLHDQFLKWENKHLEIYYKNWLLLGLGIIPGVLLNGLYNYLRYGVLTDVSYSFLPVFKEPWYQYGLFSIRYIPVHLKEILTALPIFKPDPPFIIPSMFAMAIWVVTPAFLLIPFANFRSKLVIAAAMTVVVMSIPSLTHGGNGLTQFGYRYALDFTPFLLILTASGLQRLRWQIGFILILLSIAVNLWGIIMISFLNLWGF